jgi:predicted outer membrane protein
MKYIHRVIVLSASILAGTAYAQAKPVQSEKLDARAVIENWPAKPRIAALKMLDKYGAPADVTSSKLVWKQTGPWKKTVVSAEESPHHFPQVHTDFLTQVIDYKVPADKVDEISAMDGSISVDRTQGEISVRCDKEEMNFVALNLAHEVVTGKKSVSDARDALEDAALAVTLGKKPALATGLQFAPPKGATAYLDEVTLDGSPKPMKTNGEFADAEVLGLMVTVDKGELAAANCALAKKDADAGTRRYAEMLLEHHGKSLMSSEDLADDMDMDPRESAKSKAMEADHDKSLADVLSANRATFNEKFAQMMVDGHKKALAAIDRDMLPKAKSDKLKKSLAEMRSMVQNHLASAEQLQSGVATLDAPKRK